MEQLNVQMPRLNIQRFAEVGEEETANSTTETGTDVKDVSKDVSDKTNNDSQSEKKYTDKELNDISLKNTNKALAKQLKDLGIEDVEEAKSILADARAKKEASKSVDEKTKELTQKYDKARLETINARIENALLRKGVSDSKVERATRLIDKTNILDSNGDIDTSKLSAEIEATIDEFPELIPSKEKEEKKSFKIGGDGKEDKKNDEMSEMRKIMGLK